jgi:hypothetical protein
MACFPAAGLLLLDERLLTGGSLMAFINTRLRG